MKQVKTFKEYIEFTKTTTVYPEDRALEYLTFGMVDEFGEFEEKLEFGTTYQIVDELSDVCWYVAQLFNHLDVKFEETPQSININYVDSYINKDTLDRYIKDIDQKMKLMCGYIKKYIRDDNEEKIELFKEGLTYIMRKLVKLSTQIGAYNLQNVLQINVNKLTDRAERNVLKGDGDNR